MPLPEDLQARAGSFGIDAEAYDRHRPSYPAVVVDLLLTGDTHTVVDVGCGTGKLARLLAAHGADVVGVEPDARMAAVARGHGLAVEVAPFESWDPDGRTFDLVTAAQSWHWVDQYAGAAKAAEALRPGGRLAVVWNVGYLDDDLQAALDPVYARYLPGNTGGGLGRRSSSWHLTGLEETGAFGQQQVQTVTWQDEHTTAAWLDHLGTQSDHRLLPDDQRAQLLDAVAEVVDAHGGVVTTSYDTRVIVAERT